MKFFFKRIFIPLFLLCSFYGNAQKMGQWRTYLPYNNTTKVEQTPNLVFGISDGALFSVGKEDKSIKTYSKIDGLSDYNILHIKYNEARNILLIAYANSNIDLLINDKIYNISDIKNKIIYTSKTINDIYFYNQFAYLSCDFGIVVLNLQKREVTDTYIIGANGTYLPIKSTLIKDGKIYALGTNALYSANINNPLLANYENWSQEPTPSATITNESLLLFNDNIFLLKTTGNIYTCSAPDSWSLFESNIKGMKVSNSFLLIYNASGAKRYTIDLVLEQQIGYFLSDVVYSSENCYWIADLSAGITKFIPGISTESFCPDGPARLPCYEMTFAHNRLYVVTGSFWENQQNGYPGAVMILTDTGWKNFTTSNMYPVLGYSFHNLTQIAVDKTDGKHFFVSSFGNGVYEFQDDTFYKRYDQFNSSLERHNYINDIDSIRTDGVVIDKNNNLWLTNHFASKGIKVRLATSSWLSVDNTSMNNAGQLQSFDKTTVGSNNYKWFNLPRSNSGIFVLNDKNNPSNPANFQYRWFDSFTDQDGNIFSAKSYYCITEDKNNSMWVGTNQGPIVFQSVSNVFNSDYKITRVKIPREDGTSYADYLLENEKIRCIAVDGGNRKWFGTEGSGVFLMSDDGKKTIHQFTKENSPLLSNTILSIAINPKNGEVFFGTDLGIISYTSDASEGESTYSNISVYPNPVRPTYKGVITIVGLIDESTVRITDTTGNLIYETSSNGGTATWNGQNNVGKRVASGVYLVMCSDKNGEQYGIAKIMIIN